MSGGFHRPDCAQNIARRQLGDGLFANVFIEERNESAPFLDIGCRVGILPCGEPLLSNHSEGQRLLTRRHFGYFFVSLFLRSRVNVMGEQFLCVVPLAVGLSERYGKSTALTEGTM